MALNPNWPVMEYAICFTAAGPAQSTVQDFWCDMMQRTQGTVTITRGKQYELDQVQPGQMTMTLRNDDGALDPSNTASPFYPFITPYRLIRARAQWPPTQNILLASQATAGLSDGLAAGVLPPYVTGSYALTTNGTGSYKNTVPSSPVGGTRLIQLRGMGIRPGNHYAFSVTLSATAAVSVQLVSNVELIGGGGGTIGVSGTLALTTTPTRYISTNFLAGNNLIGCDVGLQIISGSAATTVTQTNWQVELATTATSYVQPSPWYDLYTGYVERWPQEWSSAGNKGVSNITCVDELTFFANRAMRDPYLADLLALNPNFLYPLNEGTGATTFIDLAGKRGNATIVRNQSGTIAPGGSISAGDSTPQGDPSALSGSFLGASGPVLTLNTYPATRTTSTGSTISIPADPSTGVIGPPLFGGFTRMIAARLTGYMPNGLNMYAFAYFDPAQGAIMQVSAAINGATVAPNGDMENNGILNPQFFPTLTNVGVVSTVTITDTDWHLYGLSLSSDGLTFTLWSDNTTSPNVIVSGSTRRPQSAFTPSATAFDGIGASSKIVGFPFAQWVGDLMAYVELPFEMTQPIWTALYNSWRNGWSTSDTFTETSDARYGRILDWIGYPGLRRIDAGQSIQYGPAIDVVGGKTPADALTVLQDVVDTEVGQHFMGADGAVVFKSRLARYNTTSSVSFGEHTGSGEIPYMDAKTDFDPTRIANSVQVTSAFGNVEYDAADLASQTLYGFVTLTRTANSMDPNELIAQGQFLVYENKQPQTRLEVLPVDVAGHPVSWASVLGLDIGDTVTVNRRPSNAPAISITGFVEQIVWNFNSATLGATWTGQVSNSALHTFFQLNSATLGVLDTSLIGY